MSTSSGSILAIGRKDDQQHARAFPAKHEHGTGAPTLLRAPLDSFGSMGAASALWCTVTEDWG